MPNIKNVIYVTEDSPLSLRKSFPIRLTVFSWFHVCAHFGVNLGNWYAYINRFSLYENQYLLLSFGEKFLCFVAYNIEFRFKMIDEKKSNLFKGVKAFINILQNDLKNFKWSLFKISENWDVIKHIWLNFLRYGPSFWTLLVEFYKELKFLINLANYLIFILQFILFVNKNIVIKASSFLIFISGILGIVFGFFISQYKNIVATWIQKFLERKFKIYWWLMLLYYWVWESRFCKWVLKLWIRFFYGFEEDFFSYHNYHNSEKLRTLEPLIRPLLVRPFATITPDSNERNFPMMLPSFDNHSFDSHIETLGDLEKFQNPSFSDIKVEIFPFYPDENDFVIDIIKSTDYKRKLNN